MLLIGSRAICFHMPSFRTPKDWDLIASEEELQGLAVKLQPVNWRRRPGQKEDPPPPNGPEDKKHFFIYEGNMVEVARISCDPYWQQIYDSFAEAPIMEEPVLGPMRIPSLDYLLLTKQCGLAFPVMHWHKNLRDVYLLRDIVRTTTPQVAALWQQTWQNAVRMHSPGHAKRNHPLRCCHPEAKPPEDMALHQMLHERICENRHSFEEFLDRWRDDPSAAKEVRRAARIAQLAEEARVVAADRMHAYLLAHPDTPLTDEILREATTRWVRWSLREMAIGPLPLEWRYFLVNHYREIREAVPPDWALPLREIIVPGSLSGSSQGL